MSRITEKLRYLTSRQFRLSRKHRNDSYSQEGEDLVLAVLMEPNLPTSGFYVDIGAHHPTRFSNTMYFYNRGWRGLNVDARPGFATEFNALRQRDIAVDCGVSSQAGELLFYEFNEPALNTFDGEIAERRDGNQNYQIQRKVPVRVRTLVSLLDQYVGQNQQIDFLSVDVEGLDVDVLRSNDWQRYRPGFVLTEVYGQWLEDVMSSETVAVMAEFGYRACSRTRHTIFFEDSRRDCSRAAA
jgi:FkbM family methyltransferase